VLVDEYNNNNNNNWIKRSKEDLSKILSNYNIIIEKLQIINCLCIISFLTSNKPMESLDDSCNNKIDYIRRSNNNSFICL
jgi:hypothetical protein